MARSVFLAPATQALVIPDSMALKSLILKAGSADASAIIYAGDPTSNATAAAPVAGGGNVGDGTVTGVTVDDVYTRTETWTLTCIIAAVNGGTFSVTGSVTGPRGNAVVGTPYSIPEIGFTINDGATDFDVGDTFTIATTAAGYATELEITAIAKTSRQYVFNPREIAQLKGPVFYTLAGTGSFLRLDY